MLTELEQRADTEARHAHRELVEAYTARIKELEDQVTQLQWDVLRLEARLND
jgi:predicted RNase H-like nuclease (RuvC/YqgF family)